MKNILVTGGAGFIGSNFILRLLNRLDGCAVVNLDLLTYAGNLENLKAVENHPRYSFVKGSIRKASEVLKAAALPGKVEAIINFAAQTHVDRSIDDAMPFVETNVNGTAVLLEAAKKLKVRLLQVSTDEVYGSLGSTGKFTEETPLAPNSPYAASKAAADLLARAYFKTFGLDVVITRCSNNFGPFQFPEKFLPLMITNLLEEKKLPVYGDGLNVRDWIHVDDHCDGIMLALEKGKAGEIYNFGGDGERANISLVKRLISIAGKGEDLISFVPDRPAHDRRYAVDFSKARRELGFNPVCIIDAALPDLFAWYRDHEPWWRRVKSGEYREYYEKLYGRGGRHETA
jgi:dTDP-glucose 4,6-dehydratase